MLHHTIFLSNRLPISSCCHLPKGRFLHVTHPFATKNTTRTLLVRLACVKHVANVHIELGHRLILKQCDPIEKFHRIEHVHTFFWDNYKRSLQDLTQHLTTQADNNHAPHVSMFLRAFFSFKKICNMSSLVKGLHVVSN